jgi:hypothetical protein
LYGVRYEAVPVVAVSPAGVVTAVDEETWASGVKDREGE